MRDWMRCLCLLFACLCLNTGFGSRCVAQEVDQKQLNEQRKREKEINAEMEAEMERVMRMGILSIQQHGLCFTTDGSKIITVGDAIRVFDAATGEQLQVQQTRPLIRSVVSLSTQPESVLIGGNDGRLLRYHLRDERIETLRSQENSTLGNLLVTPDETAILARASLYGKEDQIHGMLLRFHSETGQVEASQTFDGFLVVDVTPAADAQHVFVSLSAVQDDLNSQLAVVDATNLEIQDVIEFPSGFPRGAAFAARGEGLIVAGGLRIRTSPTSTRVEGRLWKIEQQNGQATFHRLPTSPQEFLYLHPRLVQDGRFFITTTSIVQRQEDAIAVVGQVQCRHTETGEIVWSQDCGIGGVSGLAVSPNGLIIAACSGEQLDLFHTKTGHRIAQFEATNKKN